MRNKKEIIYVAQESIRSFKAKKMLLDDMKFSSKNLLNVPSINVKRNYITLSNEFEDKGFPIAYKMQTGTSIDDVVIELSVGPKKMKRLIEIAHSIMEEGPTKHSTLSWKVVNQKDGTIYNNYATGFISAFQTFENEDRINITFNVATYIID